LIHNDTYLWVVCLVLLILSVSLAWQAGYGNFLGVRDGPALWRWRAEELERTNQDLSTEMSRTQFDLENATRSVQELRSTIADQSAQLAELRDQKDALSAANDDLSARLDEVTADYGEHNQSCRKVEAELEKLIVESNGMEADLARINAERDQLEESADRIGDEKRDLEQRLEELSDTCRNLTRISDELESIQASISLDGEIHRRYGWYYLVSREWKKGEDGKRNTGFNRSEYLEIATGAHGSDSRKDSFVDMFETEVADIGELADHLHGQGATDVQSLNNILKFVQYLPYIYDSSDDGYVKHPMETLVEGGGDCEDTSILAAELFRKAGESGYETCLLWTDTDGDGEADHMMTGVLADGFQGAKHVVDGKEYLVCETTGTLYRVGQKPSGYEIVDAIEIG